MVEQKYTSASTSINKTKLPAIYNKVAFPPGCRILDYGCGRYTEHIKRKVEEQGCTYHPYDPYNLPESKPPNEIFDFAICSNVLNVIAEDDKIKEVIRNVVDHSQKAFFTVYEGDGSGIGKATGTDSYQRNEKTRCYADLMSYMGYAVNVKNKVIMAI